MNVPVKRILDAMTMAVVTAGFAALAYAERRTRGTWLHLIFFRR